MVVPKGFFPQQDNGTVFGGMQGSQDTSFQAMQDAALRVNNAIKIDPAVAAVINFVGGNSATNSGFVYVALKPLNERKISSSEVINRVRPKLGAIPGAMTFLQAGQDVRIGGRQSNAQYQYTIQSENLQDLVKWGPIVLAEMRKLRGFTDVNSDQQNAGLQASLTYDRQTAARLGISAQLIDDTLYDAFGQRQVSTMFTSLNQYHVVMEVDPQYWQNPTGLDAIYIRPNTTSSSVGPSPSPSPSPTPAGGDTSRSAAFQLLSLFLHRRLFLYPSVASPSPTVGPIAAPTPPSLFPGFVTYSYTDRPYYAIGHACNYTVDRYRSFQHACYFAATTSVERRCYRGVDVHIDRTLAQSRDHAYYFSANSNCERHCYVIGHSFNFNSCTSGQLRHTWHSSRGPHNVADSCTVERNRL